MQALMIEGHTRIVGKGQGYLGMPIRDEDHGGVNVMVTSWVLTPAELERLVAGAPVILRVIGTGWPPVKLDVGEPPKE